MKFMKISNEHILWLPVKAGDETYQLKNNTMTVMGMDRCPLLVGRQTKATERKINSG